MQCLPPSQSSSSPQQYFGFSEKLGPVYYPDDSAAMLSPQKKDEIENEVRGLVEGGNSRVLELLKAKEAELHRVSSFYPLHMSDTQLMP